jgi:hypothetical protein
MALSVLSPVRFIDERKIETARHTVSIGNIP